MISRYDQHSIYSPISDNSIRLLSIKPGIPSEPIECVFVTVADLTDSPPYDALSYVWGKEDSADPIICNGIQVTVTKQLAAALKHLRRYPTWRSAKLWPHDHPLHSSRNAWRGFARNRNEHHSESDGGQDGLLWIDALCINQKDDIEKACQIKMMGKIYAQALDVKIWLGEEDKEPLEFLQADQSEMGVHIGVHGRMPIALAFVAQALRNVREPNNKLVTIRPVDDTAHRNVSYGFPLPDAPEWDVMRKFFTNAWFERVWVVQEAVLASKATVLIGDWSIEWAAIGKAAAWFQSKGYAMPAVLKYELRKQQDLLPVSKSVSAWNLCSWPDDKIPLLDLLHEFRNRQATNSRDKVYATFGIAQELAHMEEHGFHPLVEPNYAKTVLEVYRDIAKFLVIEHGNLAVLSHAGASLEADWPTWVPDWRRGSVSNTLLTIQSADTYNASGDQSLSVEMSNNANGIIFQGIGADFVTAYDERLASYGFGYVTYQEEVDFVRMAWMLLSRTDEETIATFIQTLTAGLSKDLSSRADALHWFAQDAHMPLDASLSRRLGRMLKRKSDPGRFHEAFVRACVDRRFFVTKKGGLMGIGPDAMKEGDIVAILFGGRVPYLLRAVQTGYRFIGECYVPGLMDGEAVSKWKDEGSKRVVFELV